MKNIVKKFLIIFISLLMILTSNFVVNAANEEESVDESLSNESSAENSNDESGLSIEMDTDQSSEDNAESSDEDEDFSTQEPGLYKNFYSFNDKDVNITDDIFGDVYIVASGKVSINSYIGGNVFILAPNVEIAENSGISSSLYCISDTLTINSDIDENVYAISKALNLSENGNIYRDLYATAQNITINGFINRNVNISSTEIVVSDDSYIVGDFNYSSSKEIDIPENAVDGKVNYNQKTSSESNDNNNIIVNILYNIVSFIIFVIIVFLILKWIKSKLIENDNEINQNLLKYIIYGFLGLIIIPIVSIILLLLGITANVALLLIALYIFILIVSSSITIINLTNIVSQKMDIKQDSTLKNILSISAICVIYKLLQLIPYIGTFLIFIFTISGFGIILKTITKTRNKDVNNI